MHARADEDAFIPKQIGAANVNLVSMQCQNGTSPTSTSEKTTTKYLIHNEKFPNEKSLRKCIAFGSLFCVSPTLE